MALVLEAVSVTGVVQRTPVNAPRVRIIAQQGFTYRLIDDAGARFDDKLSIKRDRNTLLIDGLPEDRVVEIENFFFDCVPSAPCTFVTENLGGTANITPGSEPIGALQDGTFMMYTKGQLATVAPVAPEAEYSVKTILLGVGGLAAVGLAVGGGGGSKGGNEPAQTDSTPPEAPKLTSALLTKDPRPVLAGTAEANSTVIVSLDIDGNGTADVTYETLTNADGIWSLDTATARPTALSLPAGGLPDGANVRVIMRARDAANNITQQAATEILVIDRAPPLQTATITNYVDDQNLLTGSISADGLTNDRTPTLSGSISAALADGDKIEVLRNGVVVGAPAIVDGTLWTFTDNVADGTVGATSYTVRVADKLGNGGVQSAPFVVSLDAAAPVAPVIGIVAGDDIVSLVESGSPIVIRGTAEANAVMRITWGASEFSTTAAANGDWQVTVATTQIPGQGTYAVQAFATDAAGNTSVAGTRNVGVVTGMPSAPQVAAVTGDNRINATEATTDIVVTGTADPGSTVTLTWPGVAGPRTATTSPTGTWSVTYTAAEIAALPQGVSLLSASAADFAGNTRQGPDTSITKDTFAPTQTVTITGVTDDQALITGNVPTGGLTNDQTPLIVGTLSAVLASGETLHVFRNGVDMGVATVAGTGWSISDALTANTNYSYTARVIDAAGNTGTLSGAYDIVLDSVGSTKTAAITGVTDNVGTPVGAVASGAPSDDPSPSLSGTVSVALVAGESVRVIRNGVDIGPATVSGTTWTFTDTSGALTNGTSYLYTVRVADAAGNVGASSSAFNYIFDNATPTPTIAAVAVNNAVNAAEAAAGVAVTGTAEAGATVAVTWGATTRTAVATGGAYSITFTSAQIPADGTTSIAVVATDTAGNVSTTATRTVAVDRTVPGVPTIDPVTADNKITGTERAAGVTITGTAEAGSTVTVSWPVGVTSLTTTATGAGTYSVTFSPSQVPASGPTTVTVTATDAGGNVSTTATRAVVVATDPPAQIPTILGATDDLAPLLGAVASGGRTNDTTPSFNGSLSGALATGSTVHVFRDGADIGVATVTGTTWTFTAPSTALVNGTTYGYTARVIDVDGNTGALSSAYSLVFDNVSTAPTISPIAGGNGVSAAEAAAGVTVSGTAEAGATVAVTWGGGAPRTAVATAGGSYSVSFTGAQIPADGATTVSVVATDTAGNVSSSTTQSVAIDRTVPAAPALSTLVAGNDIVDASERLAGVTVSGTAEAGSSVAITWGTTTLNTTATGGNFSVLFSNADIPGDGAWTISAVATDIGGNVSPTGTRAVTVDSTSGSFVYTGTAAADTVNVSAGVVSAMAIPASKIDGAGGVDTLLLASGVNLDLTAISDTQVVSVERINTTNATAGNTVTLNAADVLAMGGSNIFTGAAWGNLTNSTARVQVVVDGDAGDVLNASGGWTANSTASVVAGGVTYFVYNAGSGASAVQLLIDADLTRNLT